MLWFLLPAVNVCWAGCCRRIGSKQASTASSATTGQHKHGVLPVPLHAATSSASLGQLTASPGAAGHEGVLPGPWAPGLSRKESLYWKQVLCEEKLDSW